MRHPIPADRLVEIEEALAGPLTGLGAEEAAKRRTRFGENAIVEESRGHWLELVKDTARDPMIWFLVGTGLLYALIGDRREALILLAAIVPLVGMDAYLHRRTRASTQGLQGRLASRATVVRDGLTSEIPALDLVPGDVVRVAAGELFPADGLVVRGDAVQVEESALTGEAFPVRKTPLTREARSVPAIDAGHWGFAGTRALTGDASMLVVSTGADTLYGQIARSALASASGRTRLQRAIDRLVLILIVAAAIICITLGAVRLLQGYGMVDALLSAVTLAIAAIPEEFPVVFTFFLGVGVYRLARRQALVRRAVAVEDIGRVSCLCVDKTGTLTEGRLELAHRCAADGVSDDGLVRIAALASRAESQDLLDRAILTAAPPAAAPGERLALFPFTEERRRETAVYGVTGNPGATALAVVKGAPEVVLELCALGPADLERWRTQAADLAAAHKVIACASRELDTAERDGREPERGFTFAGLLAFEDRVRDGAAEAVRRADAAGIKLIMVTGDHPANALSIARDVGIGGATPHMMLGEELGRAVQSGAAPLTQLDVVARALPAQKLMLVQALRKAGEVVAVTGDGVNDVPALKAADIGIAMGESATQSAREAGAIVLLDDNLRTIVNAVAEGRQLFRNLRLSFAYLLAVHLPFITSAALIPLLGFPLLYLPIHIVWLELIIHPTAMFAFQASADGRRPGVLRRQSRFFSARDWLGIAAAGVLVSAVLLAAFLSSIDIDGVEHARAKALVVLIVAAAASAAVLAGFATVAARVLVAATLGSTLLLTQWPPAAATLQLQPLHPRDWLIAAAAGVAASVPLLLLVRRPRRNSPVPMEAAGYQPSRTPPSNQSQSK